MPEVHIQLNQAMLAFQMSLAKVFNLGAASNTFAEQSAEVVASAIRYHSRILAIDLNKFRNHQFAYTEADVSLSATNYATQLQTLSKTPAVTGDLWLGSYFGFDQNASGRELEHIVQRDNADEPSGQTTANTQFAHGTAAATNEIPILFQAIPSLTAATAYTIDADGSADSAPSSPAAQHRSLWAVTMELAAAGAAFAVPIVTRQYRQRWG